MNLVTLNVGPFGTSQASVFGIDLPASTHQITYPPGDTLREIFDSLVEGAHSQGEAIGAALDIVGVESELLRAEGDLARSHSTLCCGEPESAALGAIGIAQLRKDVLHHIREISQKYLITGETHETAIMFVPSESVYAGLYEHFGAS